MSRIRIVDAASVVVMLGVVVVTSLVVRREFSKSGSSSNVIREVDDWSRLAVGGHRMGSDAAIVSIVEFGDFQCPYCAEAEGQIAALLQEYPESVSLVYRHLPLPAVHPYATDAALAAECAADQGRFWEMKSRLFAAQDSISIAEWGWFAEGAGIPNLEDFISCIRDERFMKRIENDMRLADEIGAVGTPTFVVNGEMFSGVGPPSGSWASMIQRMLDGATPN